jgi:hypothetical protein
MIVNWKPNRILVLNHPQAGSPLAKLSGSKATLTRAEVKQMMGASKPVVINTGLNLDVNEKAFEACVLENEEVKGLIEDRQLVVVTKGLLGESKDPKEKDEPATELPKTLAGIVDARDAVDMVEGYTFDDVKPLEAWLEAEEGGRKRNGLMEALKNQIKKIQDTQEAFAKAGVKQKALA